MAYRITRVESGAGQREQWSANEVVPSGSGTGSLRLLPEQLMQTVMGFGGAFTEATANTLSRLPNEIRAEAISRCFDRNTGLGYSLGRVPIHSCDFSLESYTYVEPGDESLSTFSLAHEEKWLFPLIRDAGRVSGSPIALVASPWSPPEWMKDNRDMKHGGSLLGRYRSAWAEYLVRYVSEMRSLGFKVDALSVQNEPLAVQTWESCIYSGEEERDFVRDYLGPALHRSGLGDVKLLVWDHNRDLMVERARVVLEDPDAAKYVWGVAFHWYEGEQFENVGRVHDLFPDTHLIFTEGCAEYGPRPDSWETGERYARNIIGDFNNWCEAHIDWNLVLDETGGPNHVGNLCDAPIIADTVAGELRLNPSYYAIGHFSRYVVPGARRIAMEGGSRLHSVAFRNPDGALVAVLLNDTDEPLPYSVSAADAVAEGTLGAHSIVTLIWSESD